MNTRYLPFIGRVLIGPYWSAVRYERAEQTRSL